MTATETRLYASDLARERNVSERQARRILARLAREQPSLVRKDGKRLYVTPASLAQGSTDDRLDGVSARVDELRATTLALADVVDRLAERHQDLAQRVSNLERRCA